MSNTSSGYTTVSEEERSTQVPWTMPKSFQKRVAKLAGNKPKGQFVKELLAPIIAELEKTQQNES